MGNTRGGLLEGRKPIAFACVLLTWISVQSWLSLRAQFAKPDLILLGSMAWSTFIAGNIAWMSPLVTDRVVFGAAAAASVLSAISRMPLTPSILLSVRVAKSLILTADAAASLACLIGGLGRFRKNG